MAQDYNERMADIMLADYERWLARQKDESATDDSRAAIADWHGETPLLRGIGMVIPPAKYPNREPRTRSVGVAVPAPDAAAIARLASCDVNPTVRVIHADGSEEILPTTHFRKSRESRALVSQEPAQERPHTINAADLPRVVAD